MITRRGIYYNLQASEYSCKVDDTKFMFSSKLHRDKFKQQLQENRDKINDSLSNRFNINIENNMLCDIVLYMRIETRGFLIYHGGEEICKENLLLNGEKLTKMN